MAALDLLFSGNFLKAGDDNSRWKSRYFQLAWLKNGKAKLQYFENDRDAAKGKSPRGEIATSDILGIAVLGTVSPLCKTVDSNVKACADLCSEHRQEGPSKLMIFSRDRFWRLAEIGYNTHVIGDLIRALDRVHQVVRFSIRMVGWMRAQGSLSWNRRYLILFSNGELLCFLDATLDHLRRRIDLAKAHEIRAKKALASKNSPSEKRVIRLLEDSMDSSPQQQPQNLMLLYSHQQVNNGNSQQGLTWSADMFDILGIRLLHPSIPEKNGYLLCVEPLPGESATALYTRFRKWIVQFQISATESRLINFVSTTMESPRLLMLSANGDEDSLLERKLLNLTQANGLPLPSLEVVKSVAWEYLMRFQALPLLHRGNLWMILSNGLFLKRNRRFSYAELQQHQQSAKGLPWNEIDRLQQVLTLTEVQEVPSSEVLGLMLGQSGEESVFWTYLGMVSLVPTEYVCFVHDGFARHVEARVIVDLLGLKLPALVAHLSSYDLTRGLIRYLSEELLPQQAVNIPNVWDAAFCVGKEAFSFAIVTLLIECNHTLLECFVEEDMVACIAGMFHDVKDSRTFSWNDLDRSIPQRLRKVQWASVVNTMREHSDMLHVWKSQALEAKEIALRTIEQCNLLCQEQDVHIFRRIHGLAVQVSTIANQIFALTEVSQRSLDHHMLRCVNGGSGENTPYLLSEQQSANVVEPLVSKLNEHLTCFALMCVSLAWRSWCTANKQVLQRHCRFLPRAHVSGAFLPPEAFRPYAAAAAVGGGGSVDDDFLPNPNPNITAPRIPTDGPFSNLANAVRRRLFHQHQPESSSSRLLLTKTNEKVPSAPNLLEAVQHAFTTYRGGFIGLCDSAGSEEDAAFSRTKQECDEFLQRNVEILSVMFQIASFSSALQRWLLRRYDSFPPTVEVPKEIQHLFLTQQSATVFDRERLKVLEQSLMELRHRARGHPVG